MAQPTATGVAHPASVIGPSYCAPHPVDLAIITKTPTLTDGNFDVIDIQGNIVFKVRAPFTCFQRARSVLLDAAGNHLVTLRPKLTSSHDRWKVFRGDSTNSGDLLFSAKRSSMFQCKTTLHVFLANNTREDVCDFKVKATFSERSCVIYAGDSSTEVAQMHKKQSLKSVFLGKDHFMVTVNPNIDYAFIVALIVILYDINRPV
ncbi:protein LURP-one-related 15-like [Alnus glutinosa]|uniref:protein LURP-one-related 15-like n=1 Tax=Alnus glutinosa TaxID=3517 RepID=UPI002D793298|nr:protein LURP-one-related 15-like [Alnus glutinosa]